MILNIWERKVKETALYSLPSMTNTVDIWIALRWLIGIMDFNWFQDNHHPCGNINEISELFLNLGRIIEMPHFICHHTNWSLQNTFIIDQSSGYHSVHAGMTPDQHKDSTEPVWDFASLMASVWQWRPQYLGRTNYPSHLALSLSQQRSVDNDIHWLARRRCREII